MFGTGKIVAAMAVCAMLPAALHAFGVVVPIDSRRQFQCEFTVTPYVASAEVVGPLDEKRIPYVKANRREDHYYWRVLRHVLMPRFWILGLDVKPVALAGVLTKEFAPEVYETAEIRPGMNLVQSVSEGWPDPGALTLFLGDAIKVIDDDDEIAGRERAGLALAIGAGHIVNNLIYPDVWFEPSLRLTGEFISRSRDMEWNFVVGMRFHASRNVRNVLFCEILRNRIDRHYYGWHPLRNTSLEYRLDLSPARLLETGEVYGDGAVNNTLLVGKRWPVRRGRNTLGLKLGAGYQWSNGYSGRMKRASEPGWTFLMRPMFSF